MSDTDLNALRDLWTLVCHEGPINWACYDRLRALILTKAREAVPA